MCITVYHCVSIIILCFKVQSHLFLRIIMFLIQCNRQQWEVTFIVLRLRMAGDIRNSRYEYEIEVANIELSVVDDNPKSKTNDLPLY